VADLFELLGHALVGGDDFIKGVGNLAFDAELVSGHADRKIADPHRLEGIEQMVKVEGIGAVRLGYRLGGGRNWPSLPRAPNTGFCFGRHQGSPGASKGGAAIASGQV
jgi:hypothetical protein